MTALHPGEDMGRFLNEYALGKGADLFAENVDGTVNPGSSTQTGP